MGWVNICYEIESPIQKTNKGNGSGRKKEEMSDIKK